MKHLLCAINYEGKLLSRETWENYFLSSARHRNYEINNARKWLSILGTDTDDDKKMKCWRGMAVRLLTMTRTQNCHEFLPHDELFQVPGPEKKTFHRVVHIRSEVTAEHAAGHRQNTSERRAASRRWAELADDIQHHRRVDVVAHKFAALCVKIKNKLKVNSINNKGKFIAWPQLCRNY